MSKDNKIIQFNKVKPKSSSELIQQVFLDEKEQEELTPIDKLAIASKNLLAGQSLPLRRETTLNSADIVSKLINDISSWKSILTKEGKDFSQIDLALDHANTVIYEYLRYFDKKIKPSKQGKAQIAQLKYYINAFKKYETDSDVFADSEYQPFIFLRQWAGILTDASLAISMIIRKDQEIAIKNKDYFPRAERMGYRDTYSDGERKLKWVESQQSELAQQQLEAEVAEHAKNKK